MLEDRVGIVIPSFNAGDMVIAAAHSARACLGGLENVVVVDDGSRDRQSRSALAELEAEGFAVVQQSNAGVSAARNRGLALLTTAYAFVLDSDDLIEPGAATRAADILDVRRDAVIVAGAGINFTEPGDDTPAISPGELTREDMRRWTMIATASAFRLEGWDSVGGFPEGVAVGEDWVFWLRLLRSGGNIVTVDEVFVRHRIHAGQTTNRSIDPREPAKAANLVLRENPDLALAHPDELIEELCKVRLTLAEYRYAYRHADAVKAKLRRFREGRHSPTL